jgi:hypothetical protein
MLFSLALFWAFSSTRATRFVLACKCRNVFAAEPPIVVEIGDDAFHKGLGQSDSTIGVAEMVE